MIWSKNGLGNWTHGAAKVYLHGTKYVMYVKIDESKFHRLIRLIEGIGKSTSCFSNDPMLCPKAMESDPASVRSNGDKTCF